MRQWRRGVGRGGRIFPRAPTSSSGSSLYSRRGKRLYIAMFTLKVTPPQESSPVAPALPLPHLAWPFTHTCTRTRTDCAGREDAAASRKLCQPDSTLSLTWVWAFRVLSGLQAFHHVVMLHRKVSGKGHVRHDP